MSVLVASQIYFQFRLIFYYKDQNILASQISHVELGNKKILSVLRKIGEIFSEIFEQTLLKNSHICQNFLLLDILKSGRQQIRKLRVRSCEGQRAETLWNHDTKRVESQWDRNGQQGQHLGLKIKKQQSLFVVVQTIHHNSFFVLGILKQDFIFLLQIQLQVSSPFIMQTEPLQFFVCFVANENLHLKIILRSVKIIERQYFTAYLNTVILEKNIFALQALFFVLLPRFRRHDQLIEF